MTISYTAVLRAELDVSGNGVNRQTDPFLPIVNPNSPGYIYFATISTGSNIQINLGIFPFTAVLNMIVIVPDPATNAALWLKGSLMDNPLALTAEMPMMFPWSGVPFYVGNDSGLNTTATVYLL